MYTEKSVVKCESGLHNRQATFFIQKANEFRSSIWIEVDDRKINAKSLLGVLSMAITTGTEVTLIAEGPDEEAAVKTLAQMLVKDIFRSAQHERLPQTHGIGGVWGSFLVRMEQA